MTKVDWHPYPDEYPPKYDRYLITIPYDVEDEGVHEVIAYWDPDRECWYTPSIFDPIAWAELPEPYDPEGEDDESSD